MQYSIYLKDKGWKTFENIERINPDDIISIAISPLEKNENGQLVCHFLAIDIDSGNFEDVKKITSLFPKDITYFISNSGNKGFHIWIFPDIPMTMPMGYLVLNSIRKKAGMPDVEIFPSSENNSRCIKIPGQIHPITRKKECFIDLNTLTEIENTEDIFQEISQGKHRTDIERLYDLYLELDQGNYNNIYDESQDDQGISDLDQNKYNQTLNSYNQTLNYIQSLITKLDQEVVLVGDYLEIFREDNIGFRILELFGIQVKEPKLGKDFLCPIHEDNHPSASFWRGNNGYIVFQDWHRKCSNSNTYIFTMPELFHALLTGQLRKLRKTEQARYGQIIALALGYVNKLALQQRERLKVLEKALPSDLPGDTFQVWEAVKLETLIHAMGGYKEISLSERHTAKLTGISLESANRSLNLLTVLGILHKLPNRLTRQPQKFLLGNAIPEQVIAIWEKLGKPNLRKFKGSYVIEVLGEDIAKNVFRGNQQNENDQIKEENQEDIAMNDNGKVINLCNFTNKQEEKEEYIPDISSPEGEEKMPVFTDEKEKRDYMANLEFIKQMKSGEYKKTFLSHIYLN